jgi:hypothetical protein
MKKEKTFSINKFLIVMVIFCFTGCSSSDDSSGEKEEEEVSLDDKYVGTWNSTTPSATFTDVPISAKLRPLPNNANRLVGELFISANFTVCCSSGTNDGTLTIDFDGNTITSFRYNAVITDCTGTFNGDGTIRSDGAFVIDFTGNDCDGSHVGQFVLKKI